MKFLILAATFGCSAIACGGTNSGSAASSGSLDEGDAGGAASCGKVSGCGGSLVGTWTAVARCTSNGPAVVSDGVCTEVITESAPTIAATAAFNTDGTYSITNGAYTQDFVFEVPMSCLTENGTPSCADWATALGGDDGVINATCASASGGGCSCAESVSIDAAVDTGTYATTDDALIMESDANGTQSATYCVDPSGSVLHVIYDLSQPGTVAVEDIVFTK